MKHLLILIHIASLALAKVVVELLLLLVGDAKLWQCRGELVCRRLCICVVCEAIQVEIGLQVVLRRVVTTALLVLLLVVIFIDSEGILVCHGYLLDRQMQILILTVNYPLNSLIVLMFNVDLLASQLLERFDVLGRR